MKRVGKMKIFMENIGKMKILKPIPYDEKLSHFRMEDYRKIDYRNYMDTALILNDYDWMDYHLKTFFNTKDYNTPLATQKDFLELIVITGWLIKNLTIYVKECDQREGAFHL